MVFLERCPMFGFIKKLFSKDKETQAAAEKVVHPVAARAYAPTPTAVPVSPDIPAPKSLRPAASETIDLPLKAVVQQLPKSLMDQVTHQPGNEARIQLPLKFVLPQLSRGLVQMAFGDLKQLSPPGTFSPSIRYDQEWISLPLHLIVPQVRPESLGRRQDQKVIHVPDEIIVVFGGPHHASNGKAKHHRVSSPVAVEPKPAAPVSSSSQEPAKEERPAPAPAPAPAKPKPFPTAPPAFHMPLASGPLTIPTVTKTAPAPALPIMDQMGKPPIPSPPQHESGPIRMPPGLQTQFLTPDTHTPAPSPNRMPSTISFDPKSVPQTPPLTPLPGKMWPSTPFVPPGLTGSHAAWSAATPVSIPSAPTPLPVTMPSLAKASHEASQPPTPPQPLSFAQPLRTVEFPAPAQAIPQPMPALAQAPGPAVADLSQMSAPPTQAAQEPGKLVAALNQVASGWPDSIRQEITQLNLLQGVLAIPCEEADRPIKQGKLAFPWKQLRSWIRPAIPPTFQSPHNNQVLDLPLPVFVPLFFAQRKPIRAGKMMSVPDVPDLFARPVVAAPAPAAVAAAQAPVPSAPPPVPASVAPAPIPLPSAAIPAPPTKAALGAASVAPITPFSEQEIPDIGDVFGQPGKRHWTPVEIAQKTTTLPGVSGALIAMQDGLLVASQVPATFNGEMIAAFLPQMFGRMSHYTAELKLGDPSSILLVVNRMPLQINRVGRVFYTVLGKPGEPLPGPAIAAVVTQLDQQSKQI
jgi:predicted regulator of Ras-like GTPase activity (Roadblock/LC7/MglB family)